MSSDNFNDNYTWWNTTASTDNIIFSGTFDLTGAVATTTFSNWHTIKTPPDKNWMPYEYFEYDPIFHKKYARYKIQMENMWKDKKA